MTTTDSTDTATTDTATTDSTAAAAPAPSVDWRLDLPPSRWHRPLLVLGILLAVLAVVTLVGRLVDDRELLGVNLWEKPLKFAISGTIYAVTWAWLIGHYTRWQRAAWWAGVRPAQLRLRRRPDHHLRKSRPPQQRLRLGRPLGPPSAGGDTVRRRLPGGPHLGLRRSADLGRWGLPGALREQMTLDPLR